MKTDETIHNLQKVVARATSNIAMFRVLYGVKPPVERLEDFQNLPVTSSSDYMNLEDVTDTVRSPWDLATSVAPWDFGSPRFPLAVLHSPEDESVLEERAEYLLAHIDFRKGEMATILVRSPQLYAASDLSDILIYLGYPCEMLLLNGESDSSLRERLARTDAKNVFLCCDGHLGTEAFPPCVEHVVGFNRWQRTQDCFTWSDMFHLDEISLIAINTGDGRYSAPPGHFFFEQSDRGTLLITTLKQDYSPFIRYDTGIRAFVSGDSFYLGD